MFHLCSSHSAEALNYLQVDNIFVALPIGHLARSLLMNPFPDNRI